MEVIKQCLLCFSELDNNNEWPEVCSRQKLFDSCDKYLHSALSKEVLQTEWNDQTVSLCPKCLQSASTLVEFSDQMDFIHKSTSEAAFIFSLEILHRRGKVGDKFGNKSGKQLIEFDVSGLPNVDNWDVTPPTLPISSGFTSDCTQETTFENDCVESNPLTENPMNVHRNTIVFGKENDVVDGVEQNRVSGLPDVDDSIVTSSVATSSGSILNGILKTFSQDQGIEIEPLTVIPVMTDNRNTIDVERPTTKRDKTKNNVSNERETEVMAGNSQRSISNVQCMDCPLLMLHKLDIKPSEEGSNRNQKLATAWTKIKPNSSNRLINKPMLNEIRREVKSNSSQPSELPTTSASGKSTQIRVKTTMGATEKPKQNYKKANVFRKKSLAHNTGPYKCNFCPKEFLLKTSMELHVRSHTGEKPCKFTLCPTSFAHPSSLYVHRRRVHSKIKPYKCPTCEKQFGIKSDLQRHLESHGGENPYKCSQCNFAAKQRRYLKPHIQRMHL